MTTRLIVNIATVTVAVVLSAAAFVGAAMIGTHHAAWEQDLRMAAGEHLGYSENMIFGNDFMTNEQASTDLAAAQLEAEGSEDGASDLQWARFRTGIKVGLMLAIGLGLGLGAAFRSIWLWIEEGWAYKEETRIWI